MKFFIDTANINEIKEAASIGILDGVTTNPTLLSREEGKPTDIIRQICEIIDGPISAEVIALIGAHVATIPFNVIEQLSKHPLTDMGIKNFLADWEKVKNR